MTRYISTIIAETAPAICGIDLIRKLKFGCDKTKNPEPGVGMCFESIRVGFGSGSIQWQQVLFSDNRIDSGKQQSLYQEELQLR